MSLRRRPSSTRGAALPRRLGGRGPTARRGWREKVGWGIGLLVLVLGIVYLLRSMFAMLFTAVVFAYLLDPVIDRFEARGYSREKGIGALFITGLVGLLVLLLVVVPSVGREFSELAQNVGGYLQSLQTEVVGLQVRAEEQLGRPLPVSTEELLAELQRYLTQAEGDEQGLGTMLQDAAPNIGKGAAGILKSAVSGGISFVIWLLNLALLPVFVFYLLRDWDRIIAGIDSMLPRPWQPTVRRLAGEIDERLGSFVRGQSTVCLILGVLYSGGLLISGIDLAIVVGMLSGALFIVPYLGTVVGVLLASLLALLKFGLDWHILAVFATFILVQALEGFVLTPYIVGDKVGLHPFVVMLALIAGGNLLGIWGMLFAIPMTAAGLVLLNEWLRSYRASNFFGAKE